MRAAGVDRAHLVGHSMGTLICQHLAAGTPDAVLSLTLFGAILEPPAAARQGLKERARTSREEGMAGIAEAVSAASVSEASRSTNPVTRAFVRESLLRQDPVGYAAHCEALSEASAADHGRIRCPTLLVAGEHDSVAPLAMARELRGRIRDARLETIAAVGHWMMVEAAARSAALLREHLEAVT
jgi:pimeloyl-ACP methyl ester carboxylesterase